MKKKMNFISAGICILCLLGPISMLHAKQKTLPNDRGYYKDVFMDAGIALTSRYNLYAADYFNMSLEAFVSTNHKKTSNIQIDTLMQTMVICGNPLDENGILLYPDGAPRFRMIYMNGGTSWTHGQTLGAVGRQRIVDFVKAGGSYLGTCAGAYLGSTFREPDSIKPHPDYTHLWPGVAKRTKMFKLRHKVVLEKNSPLLKYNNFGGDMTIDTVYHNGGCYAGVNYKWPEGTEILARYNTDGIKTTTGVNHQPVIWAYRPYAEGGRVICCGSHPEKDSNGERLLLMGAMMKYAMDGNAPVRIKGKLEMGEARKMVADTHDNNPDFTKIGDGQYHHYTLEVPKGLDTLTISLQSIKGWEKYDAYLFVKNGDFAWKGEADWQDMSHGTDKAIRIPNPTAGTYYISVYGGTRVKSDMLQKGSYYSEDIAVLNGIPYILGANLPKPKTNKK